ncbi:ketopantoate reductase family protein [Streptomyces sp. ME19-01-6]|uniref:ketopantoate reductase family protein n=1 Tax=Streptomyces sp. ME19-01-6 TaxID=3028686 RepID=UPI0029B2FF18|nr:2-dehydropantoate 2-reductase N-terminal domain-containing protein [Streptomyces sp. ME19-01-6]MDX3233895.1 2-dehydropantoate 2-reductase N-terminal domain-containing protein [Streptomyces sp. ME19-01-6]
MRYVIIGAGAVGGAIGGRLSQSGHDVVLVARGAHYDALRRVGLRLLTPDGPHRLPVPVADRPEAVELRPDDVLVLAVKTQDSVAALDAWAPRPVAGGGTAGDRLPLVCAQNGVESERLALRRFRRVYAMCVWLPSTHLEPGEVIAPCAPFTGALHLGRYPSGADETVRLIAADLAKSHFLAPVVPDVMRWKYAKLLNNVANAVEAICGPDGGEEAAALVGRAKTEAIAVLDAAGIDRASAAEQSAVRDGKMDIRPVGCVAARGGGSSWQSLVRGAGTVEADYLNGEIVLLGRLHGVPTPVNEALRRTANECARERRTPGTITAAQLTRIVAAP